ncbi:MAG: TIGR02444 family protein [Candidatus Puniceispirillum sp.]|nr:TIGR02444 family protein [Candidatus Puniceispirillum sp.]
MTITTLWSFASTVYQRDGVAAACLGLQEDAHVDVPLMLCVAYACLQNKHIGNNAFVNLQSLARPWQTEIVQSLRRIRTRLKTGPHPAPNEITDELRNKVKAAELAAEKIQIEMMQIWADALPAANQDNSPVTLPALIDAIGIVVTASSQHPVTPNQADHIKLIATAALGISSIGTS